MLSSRALAVGVAAALATALVGISPARAATPTTVYVATTGDDANPGTDSTAPVRTLQRAQDIVRGLIPSMTTDLTVQIASGKYVLSAPLVLTPADSGINGHRVIWTSTATTPPVISGATKIIGWHVSAAGSGLWEAPVPAGLNTRQLYVNNNRARRAAGPAPVTLTSNDTGYTTSADTMSQWRNPSDLEFVYTGGDDLWSLHTVALGSWTEARCPVGAVSGTTITMAQPCWDNSTKRAMRTDLPDRSYNLVGPGTLRNPVDFTMSKNPAYVENAFELLDAPGEWYLDRSLNTIYYKPKAGEDLTTADVEAPVLESLVTGLGTATDPIHDLTFSHLEFAFATWLRPSTPEGFSEIQAGYTLTGANANNTQGLCQFIAGGTCPYGAWSKEPGNVSFAYGQRISFLNNIWAHLGAAGLDLGNGTQGSLVQGNVFTDLSGNGIELGGVDIPLSASIADHTSDNKILDNHLYSLPVEFHGGVAIQVGYAERTLISHNLIDHTPYTAISIGWGGWPDKIKQSATPNYSNRNVISYNKIDHALQYLSDGGGIYTQGITGTSLADGEQVIGNVVLGDANHGHAIYTDNGCTYETIKGNVEFGNTNDWGGRHVDYQPGHTGNDATSITDNYWQQGDKDSSSSNVTLARNRIIASLSEVPASVLSAAGLESPYAGLAAEKIGPITTPDAPAQVAAFGANGSAYVSFTASYVDHRAPVTSYVVTATPGGVTTTISAAALEAIGYAKVAGLANGTSYTFTVAAANSAGVGTASLPSSAVTPVAVPVTKPAKLASVGIAITGRTVRVTWGKPSSSGSTPIIGYDVTVSGRSTVRVGGHRVLALTYAPNYAVTLPAGTYMVTVRAVNAVASSDPTVSASFTL